ncbi:LacI family DNA-binding transcriptional regulator [uncultured Tyzzerella sp.]|uniref:LacI family DNA-binding transcriptional regulator n=1 Tax=uncultured Tyzzerella sp. TaxID=2321398 RepID=UPI002941E551|nr:LacI family DNA-binding transcriptional regulator [uncultured Tyzzerella sp.]
MSKSVKMKDIAERLGVSIVTVSKALSNKQGVSDELRAKIKEIAIDMGYKSIANSKNEDYTYNIGVIVAQKYMDVENSFYFTIYNNIVKHLSNYNYYAILEVIDKEKEIENIVTNIILDKRIDGIIILGQMEESYTKTICKQNMPVIFLDFYDRHFLVDSVIGDNIYSAYAITNYLIENGHKHIGYVGNIHSNRSILDRYLGYSKALLENGIEINKDFIIDDRDTNGAFYEFKLPSNLPTAFVCNSDKTAYYFVQYLNKIGLSVPNDISIVGFDNDIHARICNPPITTVQIDIDKMAKKCISNIIKKIKNPLSKADNSIIPGNIVIRQSVKGV